MASTPKKEYQAFLCKFKKNSAMATLGLKEMGKSLWEGKEEGLPCWLSHFSKTKLRQPTWNFPILFKPEFIGKMQNKVWYYEKWVGRHASFPPRRPVKILPTYKCYHNKNLTIFNIIWWDDGTTV